MDYRQVKPSPSVSRFVEFFWMLEDCSPAIIPQRILPDGRPVLILNFGSPFESCTQGIWKSQPQCFFVGQITGPLLLRPSGPAAMLGIQFRPHGAAMLLKMPMFELTDSALALETLSHQLFHELDSLREFASPARALTNLDSILHRFAEQSCVNDQLVSYAVNDIERSGGLIGIPEVANRLGLSTRQLQRRFKDSVGISPKLFGRMQRFQRVFRAMETDGLGWVNVAANSGYYDQAHLIRDFREFAGKPPSGLLDVEVDLARHFLEEPAMSHFSKTPAVESR
jgi:AraC-like DNA-binding protein